MAIIRLKDVSKSYVQGKCTISILKCINFAISKGECVGIIGPSGSGKTTFLQIVGLLDSFDSGMITMHDKQITTTRAREAARRDHIGFVYQFHHLLPEFSALENITIAQQIKTKKVDINAAKEILHKFGLSDRSEHRPSKLSGGEQQRVAIARALINSPSILLADEPTGNLDDITASVVFDEMMKFVREKGVSAIIATHNKALTKQMDSVFNLEHGELSRYVS